jgi:hypothetical protein
MAARKPLPRGIPLAPRSRAEQGAGNRRILEEMLGRDLVRLILDSANQDTLPPVIQWLRELFVSNVRHVSQTAFQRRLLGRARDPHGGRARSSHDEEPGLLGALRSKVERAIAAHEALIDWHSERERVELDVKRRTPTGRRQSQVFRIPASYRVVLEKHLKRVLFPLRNELGRGKGRVPTLVWPVGYTQALAVRDRHQTLEARLRYLHNRAAKSTDTAVRASAQREVDQLSRELKSLPPGFRPARPRELMRTLGDKLLAAGAGKGTAQVLAHKIIDRLHTRVAKVRTSLHPHSLD